jgi:hypothetical protein
MDSRRHARWLALMMAVAAAGCGSNTGAGGQPATSPATATASPPACAAASPPAHAPIGAAQALSIIRVGVLSDVPVSTGVLKLGLVSCVNVGVGQVVSVDINARVPPWPAEAHQGMQLLSSIALSPAVPSPATVPRAAEYTIIFTARAAGTTAVTYLPATCTLPPGVC